VDVLRRPLMSACVVTHLVTHLLGRGGATSTPPSPRAAGEGEPCRIPCVATSVRVCI
jgi:hypothetical protein